MNTPLALALEEARAHVARLERQAAAATCVEIGHDWRFIGGRSCCCELGGGNYGCCSFSVHECSRCGDCDYGDNDEATEIRAACEEGHAR